MCSCKSPTMSSESKDSTSRPAVPFPTAITLQLCSRTSSTIRAAAAVFCSALPTMCRMSRAKGFPQESSTTALQPLLNPGSIARTIRPATGGCNSRFLKFRAKTAIACSSEASVISRRTSRSRLGKISRDSASRQQPLRNSICG